MVFIIGLPHTLEHLVFMGSEEYPFKGVLDKLANRALASGKQSCVVCNRWDIYSLISVQM
jgi:predicted Zn-dependent peptidase